MAKKREMTEREKLINSLLIHVYFGMCKDIKTETLKQILELIEKDCKENE